MSSAEEATISIPSLLIVGVIIFFSYRYFFSASNSSSSGSAASRSNGFRFTPAQVDQISQMFPQLSRRDIMWDLHRNRGSVQATTERVLGGRGLDPAPPSFQPPIQFTTIPSSTPATLFSSRPVKIEPDLITRYNLQSKISSSDKGKEREVAEETEKPTNSWVSNKDERHRMLQKRRDEMILKARRMMQEKERERGGGEGMVPATAT